MLNRLAERLSRFAESPRSRIALALAAVFPALALGVLIATYGYNIPYLDQWEVFDLFSRVHQHALTFSDLFAQHGEHRMFFPRLFFLAAYFFEPYTDLIELWMSWSLACLSALCLWRLARSTGWTGIQGLLLLIAANAMVFNLLAFEDWLWGFQIGFLFPVFCVTAAVSFVTANKGARSFFWAAFWSAINSFSVASGLLTWIILFPLLLFPEGKFHLRWKGLLLHLLGFGLCLVFYLHHYVKPPPFPGPSPTSDPVGALVYFLLYLGAPLGASSLWSSFTVGSFFLVIYLSCAALLIRFLHQSPLVARALPWLTLTHYGFLCAAATTFGRMALGPWQALSSRYIVFSSLIPIGLLFAGACLYPAFVQRLKSPGLRQILGVIIVALPLLCFARYVWKASTSVYVWRNIHLSRVQTQAAIVFINLPYDAPILDEVTYPHADALKHLVDLRNQLSIPQTILPDAVLTTLEDPSPPNPSSGLVTAIAPVPNGNLISGWAYLPHSHRPADLILVTLPDQQNRDTIVGMALPKYAVPDIAKTIHCRHSIPLGWTIFIRSATNLTGLKAWTFDGQTDRAYPIPLR